MTTSWPVLASIAVLGLFVGSFLNVVAYRLPRGESLLHPRSHWTQCTTPLRALLVEAGTALLMVSVTLRFGVTPELPAYLYFASVAVVLALIDADQHQLPDAIVLPAYVVGALLLMPAGAAAGTWHSAARAAIGMAALYCIYAALQLACPTLFVPGYVKLAGLLGLFLGWVSWGALLVGVIIGLVVTAASAKAVAVIRPKQTTTTVAYAPCMIAGAGSALFAAAPVLGMYAALTGIS